jgi:hypothetical protein
MTIVCSQGHQNPDGSMFCDECGEALSQPAGQPAAQSYGPPMGQAAAQPMASPAAVASMPPAQPYAPPSAAPKLTVESDSATFDLGGKSEWMIGREDAVSNIFPDIDLTPHGGEEGGVSRMHAKIYVQGPQYLLEDQNSTNFTFINRQKLAPKTPTPINNGDEIKLGRVVMRFTTV